MDYNVSLIGLVFFIIGISIPFFRVVLTTIDCKRMQDGSGTLVVTNKKIFQETIKTVSLKDIQKAYVDSYKHINGFWLYGIKIDTKHEKIIVTKNYLTDKMLVFKSVEEINEFINNAEVPAYFREFNFKSTVYIQVVVFSAVGFLMGIIGLLVAIF